MNILKKVAIKLLGYTSIPFQLAVVYKGGLQKKIKYYHFAKMVSKQGVVPFRIERLANWYTNDWFNYDKASQEEKLFLIEKGYAPYKMNRYGLTKDNYTDYLSDFELYSPRHYVDNRFVELFEHKLNTYYLLAPFKKYMPKHYWYIDNSGNILPIDNESNNAGTISDLLLLIEKGQIAAKACLGGHGRGFYKFEKKNELYFVNNKQVSTEEVERTLSNG